MDDLDRWLTFASHGRADFNSVTISEYLWGSIGAIEPHQSRFVRAPLRAQFTNPTLIRLTWKGHTVRDLTLATISNGNWVNFTEFNHICHTVILWTAHPYNYIRLVLQQNNSNSVTKCTGNLRNFGGYDLIPFGQKVRWITLGAGAGWVLLPTKYVLEWVV